MSSWRAAGMTYLRVANLAAGFVRNCVKEPKRTRIMAERDAGSSMVKIQRWEGGKLAESKFSL